MSKFMLFHEEGRPLLVNLDLVTTASPIAQGEQTRLHFGEGEGDGFSHLDEDFDQVVLRLAGQPSEVAHVTRSPIKPPTPA